ncbi:glycosyltransferase [Aggregatibacter actinomycetemcomitans]|uniref:ORF12 protein n=1 Tax=Aggregatibacter actinomycetemcomitans TaxID=714 RepID=Q9XDQ2_AGGAC|nr:glycosyltransferase [Aggregatibacter actinomycetemcomitans]BAA82538.1 ORF12 [Aggregatibacter actinomycetemcomitans]
MTLELAKTFKELDFTVYVSAFEVGQPLIDEFSKSSINIVNIYNLPDNEDYDIIWAHHFITLEYCLLDKRIKSNKIIFSSLSPYTPLECPPFVLDKISLFLANSLETKDKLVSMGIKADIISIFPNPVPSYFFNFNKNFNSIQRIKKIAIISNHLPQELLIFSQEANKYQLSVDIIGFGFKEILVTPKVLIEYDAVITIGKTAQYCLSLGIPVYCYDIFGGSGWINLDNIKKLSEYNFSGRDSNKKKDYIEITNDILNYKVNFTELSNMVEYSNINYNMYNLVKYIIKNKFINRNEINKNTLLNIITRQRNFYIDKIFGDGFCQLFLNKENHFSEENSFKKKIINNSIVDAFFNINSNEVSEFRFDPSNNPALFSGLEIIIHYKDNSRENIYNYSYENLIKLDNGNFFSLSSDPRLFFKSKKNKFITLINVRYYLYNNNLYEKIIQNYISKYKTIERNDLQLENISSRYEGKIKSLENKIHFNLKKHEDELRYLKNKINFNLKEYEINLLVERNKIEILNNKIISKNNILRKLYNKYRKNVRSQNDYIVSLSNQRLVLEKNLSEIINDREKKIRDLDAILTGIMQSRGYKLLMKIKKIFNKTDYDILRKSGLFNSEYYLNNNQDVREANVDPIQHFLDYGWKEGRNPSPKFDLNSYLDSYNDVKSANINPLLHYVKYGKKEGRKIKPVEFGMLYLIKNMIFLIKKNPSLISKFFFLLKSKGIRYAIQKSKNKSNLEINKKTKNESNLKINEKTNEVELLLDELLLSLNIENLSRIKNFYHNYTNRPIDIIIPVYNGYEFLDKLFESIKENTSLPYRLLISDDKSSDERVVPFIERFIEQNPDIDAIFIKNKENLGFLKTVNLLSTYAENHLVLLNTDTELPEFWLERLMYPIFTNNDIASTTPFTNSGTICSFPNYLVDNKYIYGNLTLEKVDNIFKLVNVDSTMLEVPTGVGFCMGVNFNVVKEIGMFDEIYGKGYGEENDWCQRAISAGYKNIHITNLFVYHKHGGSFLSEDKIRNINEHYQTLLNKFPTYDNQIQKIIKDNALNGLRILVRSIISFKHSTKENVLIVDHELGGGANLYQKQKVKEMINQAKGIIVFSYNITKNIYSLSFLTSEFNQCFVIKNINLILDILDFINIEEIILNGVVSFPNVYEILNLVLRVKDKCNANLVFPLHDYFCISPSYTLLTENNIYNGVPKDLNAHSKFLKNSDGEFKLFCKENNALVWQSKWEHFLSSCNKILCFSHSSEDILIEAYPALKDKLSYIPHDISGTFENVYRKQKNSKRVIGILGNINLAKGSSIIKEIIEYIDKHSLNIQVVLIGNLDIEIRSDSFIKTGSYKKSDVPSLLIKYEVNEFLIPSICPETYSYTTDEIMQLGYPITVFNLGAPAERVKLYEKGRVINLNSKNYIEEICQLWF